MFRVFDNDSVLLSAALSGHRGADVQSNSMETVFRCFSDSRGERSPLHAGHRTPDDNSAARRIGVLAQ